MRICRCMYAYIYIYIYSKTQTIIHGKVLGAPGHPEELLHRVPLPEHLPGPLREGPNNNNNNSYSISSSSSNNNNYYYYYY